MENKQAKHETHIAQAQMLGTWDTDNQKDGSHGSSSTLSDEWATQNVIKLKECKKLQSRINCGELCTKTAQGTNLILSRDGCWLYRLSGQRHYILQGGRE